MPTFNEIFNKHLAVKDKAAKHYQKLAIEVQQDVEMRTLALTIEPALHHALMDYCVDNGITRGKAITEILHSVLVFGTQPATATQAHKDKED